MVKLAEFLLVCLCFNALAQKLPNESKSDHYYAQFANVRRALKEFIQITDHRWNSSLPENIEKCPAKFLLESLSEQVGGEAECGASHTAIIESLFESGITKDVLARFLVHKSIMLPDAVKSRIDKAMQSNSTCDLHTLTGFGFYQGDTFIYYKILFGKQPQVQLNDDQDSHDKDKYFLLLAWYEIIFANLPGELAQFFECIADLNSTAISDACFDNSSRVIGREKWIDFQTLVDRSAIKYFSQKHRRKIDYVLEKGDLLNDLFNEQCPS